MVHADYNMNMSNMPNGMYGGFGGNMGMSGMNDMSAMNMMNYGGGLGNGWQDGMNGGFGNFNGYNSMGGYNQSGAQYPQMMNQFPKNNFQNPQNRFHANGASSFAQQKNNRRGSYGNVGNQNQQNGPGFQQSAAHSRPGSRAGPQNNNVRRFHKELSATPSAHLPHPLPLPPKTDVSVSTQRDGEPPAGNAEAAVDAKVKDEHAEASVELQLKQDGKADIEGPSESVRSPTEQTDNAPDDPNELTRAADDETNTGDGPQAGGLNQIQTIESMDVGPVESYDQPMMNGVMPSNQGFGSGMMMNEFSGQDPSMAMNGAYDNGMGFNQHQNRHVGSGGFNAAYGAATVLVGEPKGVGVEGAPTGPRAMREGRPNTGFSSRVINTRHHQPSQTPSAPAVQEVAASPTRKGRG
jgi:hypothetical protein